MMECFKHVFLLLIAALLLKSTFQERRLDSAEEEENPDYIEWHFPTVTGILSRIYDLGTIHLKRATMQSKIVPNEMCDAKFPNCRITGGVCELMNDDITCCCQEEILYDEINGCTGSVNHGKQVIIYVIVFFISLCLIKSYLWRNKKKDNKNDIPRTAPLEFSASKKNIILKEFDDKFKKVSSLKYPTKCMIDKSLHLFWLKKSGLLFVDPEARLFKSFVKNNYVIHERRYKIFLNDVAEKTGLNFWEVMSTLSSI